MSIRDTQHIDFIADGEGFTSLIILDEDRWSGKHNHRLKDKINFYIWSLHQGVLNDYPQFTNPNYRIELVCVHEPNKAGLRFLESTAQVIKGQGFAFTWKRLEDMKAQPLADNWH